jgi:hypothetical protein
VILRQHLVALSNGDITLRNRRVALRAQRRDQRMQRCDIGWKMIGVLAHARYGIRFARDCSGQSVS